MSIYIHILRLQQVVAFEGFARISIGRWVCFVEKLSRSASDWRQLEFPSPNDGCLATTVTHEDVDAATVLFTLSFPPQPRELDLAGEEADEARGEVYPLVSRQGADAEADRAEGRRHLLPTNQT
jgi:hypothetical protein